MPPIPGFWHRRALRAIKERAALRSPLSFEEREALESQAKEYDSDAEIAERSRIALKGSKTG
jgi:hypothetical protein